MSQQVRHIAKIIKPQFVIEGAGVKLKRSIATRELNYVDPFLLFDHFGSDDPKDYLAGFPLHPHRGIETVTYMLEGTVNHKDSIGNAGTIGAGDVQWMTSGRGIMHEEMPKPKDGKMEGFQLWVNLPARLKMSEPRYQEIPSASIPVVTQQNGASIRVIAGEVDGVRGPVTEIAADPLYFDVSLADGGSFAHTIEKDFAAVVYVFEGEGRFPGNNGGTETVKSPTLLVLEEGDLLQAEAAGASVRFLFMSGKPLNEPIARGGPFVMNTRDEIQQAFEELRNGTFIK
jgi:redox-sensitive bicupin YhaK (pirin superfamily)